MLDERTQKRKVFIAEGNEKLAGEIAKSFEESNEFEVAAMTQRPDVLDLISAMQPDVAVVDFSIPANTQDSHPLIAGCMEFLRQVKQALNSDRSVVIAIDLSTGSSDGIRQAAEFGADYLYLKPLRADELVKMAAYLHDAKRRKPSYPSAYAASRYEAKRAEHAKKTAKIKSPDTFAAELLFELGVSNNMRGYAYIKSSIVMVLNDNTLLAGVTKSLYPAIAKNYHVTVTNIEHSIHVVLERALERDSEKFYKALNIKDPGPDAGPPKCPTIKEFLNLASEIYKKQLRAGG